MSVLPHRKFLDPRPASEARERPYADSVNIPFDELPSRTFELPSPQREILVASEDLLLARQTADWLASRGRRASLVEASLAKEFEVPGRLWSPNPLISRFVDGLVPGLAIDLGCGTGRDAVYLASIGWRVIAIDVLPDAIVRAEKFAERALGSQSHRIQWVEGDVKGFVFGEPVQLLVSFRFLELSTLQRGMGLLSPNGLVLGEVFTPTNREKNGRPGNPNLVMDAKQASLVLHGMKVLDLKEVWEEGSHFLRFAATGPTADGRRVL